MALPSLQRPPAPGHHHGSSEPPGTAGVRAERPGHRSVPGLLRGGHGRPRGAQGGGLASPTHPERSASCRPGQRVRQRGYCRGATRPCPARGAGRGKGTPGLGGWSRQKPSSVQQIVPSAGGGEARRRKSLPEPFLPILKSTRDSQGPHQGPALDLHFRTAVYNTCVVGTPRGSALVSCKWGAESLGLPGGQQRGCRGRREHDGPVVFACRR